MFGVILLAGYIEYSTWDKVIPIHEETARFIIDMQSGKHSYNPLVKGFAINSEIVGRELVELAERSRERSGIGAFVFAHFSGEPNDTIALTAPPNGGYCPTQIIHECWNCACCGSAHTVCVLLFVSGDGMCIYRCYPCPAVPPNCDEPPGGIGTAGGPSCGEILSIKPLAGEESRIPAAKDYTEIYTVGGKLIYRGPADIDVEKFLRGRNLRGLFIIREHVKGRVLSRKVFIR